MKGKKMTIGTFGEFVAPEKVNPYNETLVAFVKASDANPNAAWTVELDAAKETTERILIAEAANAVGKTARLRERDDSDRTVVGQREKSGNAVYGGKTRLTFTLAPKHAQRRGKDANGNDILDAPAEEEVKATKSK
jgi:hypothetical protein